MLIQRDEQIQISSEIFMTPLHGCSEITECGMPIKYVFKVVDKRNAVVMHLHIKSSLCTGYLHRNHRIAQVTLKLHAKLIQNGFSFHSTGYIKNIMLIYYI